LAVEAGVQPQTLGDGQHDLPVGDGRTDLLGHVNRGQQGAFLVAGRTHAALLAGEGHEHLVVAVGAADAGEAFVQVAALQKSLRRALDDRAPETVLGRKPLVIDLLEGLEMLLQQPPQVGGMGVTGAVQRQRLDTRGGHDRQGTGPEVVYATPLDQMYTSCQAARPSPAGNRPLAGRFCRAGRAPAAWVRAGRPIGSHGLVGGVRPSRVSRRSAPTLTPRLSDRRRGRAPGIGTWDGGQPIALADLLQAP
jgi:hypothetical protein